MATNVRKLKIDELSLVDRPANPGADVLLHKRAVSTRRDVLIELVKREYKRDPKGRFASGVGNYSGAGGSGVRATGDLGAGTNTGHKSKRANTVRRAEMHASELTSVMRANKAVEANMSARHLMEMARKSTGERRELYTRAARQMVRVARVYDNAQKATGKPNPLKPGGKKPVTPQIAAPAGSSPMGFKRPARTNANNLLVQEEAKASRSIQAELKSSTSTAEAIKRLSYQAQNERAYAKERIDYAKRFRSKNPRAARNSMYNARRAAARMNFYRQAVADVKSGKLKATGTPQPQPQKAPFPFSQ